MPTQSQVQIALDTKTIAVFSGAGVSVFLGNQSSVDASEGTATYVTQKVMFVSNNQLQLGRREIGGNCPRRNEGYILFFLHYRVDQGDAERNRLQPLIHRHFASQGIGGATLRDARVVSTARVENWAILGIQVPFFFDEYEV